MFDLKGKTAFVTGASRGIGRSVAVSLAQAGADVALIGRDTAALEETLAGVKATGRRALALKTDVTSADSIAAAVSETVKTFGKIDTLVCNAGVQKLKPFLDMQPEDWRGLISTNLEGAIMTMQAVGKGMVEQKSGSIITMSSIYSFIGAPWNSIYCMTKGGLAQLSKALAVQRAGECDLPRLDRNRSDETLYAGSENRRCGFAADSAAAFWQTGRHRTDGGVSGVG
jgi:NAD(P)-dependent dehydrogenase (short-subunit alcohol dehydrogenase family)